MTEDYCFRCGVHGLISQATAWCGECTERWRRERAAEGASG
jgi:hypothetical protein